MSSGNVENYGSVIVTGGGYGIGRATSHILATEGWSLIVVDRDHGRAADTVVSVQSSGGRAEAVAGDVKDPAVAEAAVRAGKARFGRVTGLVTCAAVRHEGGIAEISRAQWEETLNVNVSGVFNFCKAVVPEMIAAGGGSIVNVSSPAAFGRRGLMAYSASKAAVNALSACLAADHVNDRIRVNTVLPGFTVSGMTENYPAERTRRAVAHSAAGRAGTPEDAARLIAFLMSRAGEAYTGGLFGSLPLPT